MKLYDYCPHMTIHYEDGGNKQEVTIFIHKMSNDEIFTKLLEYIDLFGQCRVEVSKYKWYSGRTAVIDYGRYLSKSLMRSLFMQQVGR